MWEGCAGSSPSQHAPLKKESIPALSESRSQTLISSVLHPRHHNGLYRALPTPLIEPELPASTSDPTHW